MSERNYVKWIVLGFVGLVLLGLAGWIGIALILGAFWAAAPAGTSGGPRLEPLSPAQLLEFPGNWQPPAAGASVDTLFPSQVAAWTHLGHDASTQIPELNLDREVSHGRYESGTMHVDVYLSTASAFEANDVFDRAQTIMLRSGSAVHYPRSHNPQIAV